LMTMTTAGPLRAAISPLSALTHPVPVRCDDNCVYCRGPETD